MEKNNLKVGVNDSSEIRREVSTKKASMEVPTPNSNKVNSAVLATKESFIIESLSAAWNLLRWRPWYVAIVPILISMLAGIVVLLPMIFISILIIVLLATIIANNIGVAIFIGIVILFLIGLFIYLFLKFVLPASMFQYIFIRDLLLGRTVDIQETFKSLMDWKLIGRFLGGTFLQFLIIIGGLILFIIPGIIWAIKYMFVPILILDKKMGVRESLRISGKMTNGYKWPLFGYVLLVGVIGLGLLGILLGNLVIAPVYFASYVFIYLVFSRRIKSVKLKTTKAPTWQIASLIVVSVLLQILSIIGNLTGGQ